MTVTDAGPSALLVNIESVQWTYHKFQNRQRTIFFFRTSKSWQSFAIFVGTQILSHISSKFNHNFLLKQDKPWQGTELHNKLQNKPYHSNNVWADKHTDSVIQTSRRWVGSLAWVHRAWWWWLSWLGIHRRFLPKHNSQYLDHAQ